MAEESTSKQFDDNMSEQLTAEIVELSKIGPTDQAVKPDLEDEQKRWLIIGICLHSVISPALRRYVPSVLSNLYNSLKLKHNIHNQKYPNYLSRYPPTNKELNYETINNNKTLPFVKGRKDVKSYDFNVSSVVDLSKLFLMTSMSHYTGFDETCDSSALLGVIINVDQFPPVVRSVAEKVRSCIRNPWAHCNFTEWDETTYLSSFQQMKQLILSLKIDKTDETTVLSEIKKWEVNGTHLLHGPTIGFAMSSDICRYVSLLAEYSLQLNTGTESKLETLQGHLNSMQNELQKVMKSVNTVISSQVSYTENVEAVQQEVQNLKCEAKNLSTLQSIQKTEIKKIEKDIQDIEEAQQATDNKVSSLEISHRTASYEISELKKNMTELRSDMTKSHGTDRNMRERKIFFYPPNRIECFIGREDELDRLVKQFDLHCDEQYSQAVSGLGGCGKTSLAIELSWYLENFYSSGIFWMSAESEEAFENSVLHLAFDINTNGENLRQTLIQTLKWISLLPERWLLVIDNVDIIEIKGSLKYALLGDWKYKTHGHILVTSRRNPTEIEETLKIKSIDCIILDTLTEEKGVQFIKLRTGRDDEDETDQINILVKELGGLPLALEQAGAHIKVLKCSFKEYNERFKKLRFKLLKSSNKIYDESSERLTIRTTWNLNFEYVCNESNKEGLGSTASIVMNIAAFLYADVIPFDIFNDGSPRIDNDDIKNSLSDTLGVKQVIEILTRYSLFQQNSPNNLRVHRLVQEVIREQANNQDDIEFILLSAARMINKALNSTTCPYDILRNSDCDKTLGSLSLWNTLALNANNLKQHIFTYLQSNQGRGTTLINFVLCKLLQTTAVHHSVQQRQGIALCDQDQMLHYIASIDLTASTINDLTCIKIPIFEKERLLIQNCISAPLLNISIKENQTSTNEDEMCYSETLRLAGNKAFKADRYHDAIKYYSDGIKISRSSDYRLYSNRSLMYLKIEDYENALLDANESILIAPNCWKGFCWKAYAIANLIRIGKLNQTMETAGLASACMAAYLNENCLLEFKMKIHYPLVVYQIVDTEEALFTGIASLVDRPYTTLMIRKGRYIIKNKVPSSRSLQIIGIEEGVEIYFNDIFCITTLCTDDMPFKFKREVVLSFYFENLTFIEGSEGISVSAYAIATFNKCTFSNGRKGCEDFPRCLGQKGCISQGCRRNAPYCRMAENTPLVQPITNGVPGLPGLQVISGGKAYVDNCTFDGCGGSGILSEDDGSRLDVKNSTFKNLKQNGIEARKGGYINVLKNKITENKGHGIVIGPRGFGDITGNMIQNNLSEGVFCCEQVSYSSETDSRATVTDNIISQNGLSGVSLNRGTFNINKNKIFENWLWGMMIKARSSTYILNNDIFENKCGGIRIGINYSASVIIDGNTIRNHSGPGIYVQKDVKSEIPAMVNQVAGETETYTLSPIITDRNFQYDNHKGLQHFFKNVAIMRTCSFCHNFSDSLKRCTNCKKASYCSKECQRKHWQRHKYPCKLLKTAYTVEIKMKMTTSNKLPGFTRTFDPSLKGILTGTPPNPESLQRFIVKIQSGREYSPYNPNKPLVLYDQTATIDIAFFNPKLYHLVNECGILSASKLTTKKIFCWASFKDNGKILCVYTDSLPALQTW